MAIDTQAERQVVLRGYSGILASSGVTTVINQFQWANVGADLYNGTFNFVAVKLKLFAYRGRECQVIKLQP